MNKGNINYYPGYQGRMKKMKKKILAISCIMLFLLFVLPTSNSQELVKDTALNSMPIAHVVIKGNGTVRLVYSIFLPGFGRCLAMIVTLKTDGHVEINKLFDTSNITELEGSRVVILIWFIGAYYHESGINLN
jgi:hypothetical protein